MNDINPGILYIIICYITAFLIYISSIFIKKVSKEDLGWLGVMFLTAPVLLPIVVITSIFILFAQIIPDLIKER